MKRPSQDSFDHFKNKTANSVLKSPIRDLSKHDAKLWEDNHSVVHNSSKINEISISKGVKKVNVVKDKNQFKARTTFKSSSPYRTFSKGFRPSVSKLLFKFLFYCRKLKVRSLTISLILIRNQHVKVSFDSIKSVKTSVFIE